MQELVSGIRLRDLELFLEVTIAKSVREVARRTGLTPGQVSRSIQQLESRLGTRLYKRSVSGMLPTTQGAELLEIARELVANGERIENLVAGRGKGKFAKVIAVAGTSFINTHFSTPLICRAASEAPDITFRFLDVAPDQMVPVALRGGFDVAIHYGALSWPSTWVSQALGKTRWQLCAGIDHPLSRKATLKQALEYRFVVPTYWTAEGLVKGNDQFPVPFTKRKRGFETATADAAVPILSETDHLAFLPAILAQPFLDSKRLKEIKPADLQVVDKDLYLSARADTISQSLFKLLSSRLSDGLKV